MDDRRGGAQPGNDPILATGWAVVSFLIISYLGASVVTQRAILKHHRDLMGIQMLAHPNQVSILLVSILLLPFPGLIYYGAEQDFPCVAYVIFSQLCAAISISLLVHQTLRFTQRLAQVHSRYEILGLAQILLEKREECTIRSASLTAGIWYIVMVPFVHYVSKVKSIDDPYQILWRIKVWSLSGTLGIVVLFLITTTFRAKKIPLALTAVLQMTVYLIFIVWPMWFTQSYTPLALTRARLKEVETDVAKKYQRQNESILTTLTHPVLLQRFRNHLSAEWCSESLDFFMEVLMLQALIEEELSSENIREQQDQKDPDIVPSHLLAKEEGAIGECRYKKNSCDIGNSNAMSTSYLRRQFIRFYDIAEIIYTKYVNLNAGNDHYKINISSDALKELDRFFQTWNHSEYLTGLRQLRSQHNGFDSNNEERRQRQDQALPKKGSPYYPYHPRRQNPAMAKIDTKIQSNTRKVLGQTLDVKMTANRVTPASTMQEEEEEEEDDDDDEGEDDDDEAAEAKDKYDDNKKAIIIPESPGVSASKQQQQQLQPLAIPASLSSQYCISSSKKREQFTTASIGDGGGDSNAIETADNRAPCIDCLENREEGSGRGQRGSRDGRKDGAASSIRTTTTRKKKKKKKKKKKQSTVEHKNEMPKNRNRFHLFSGLWEDTATLSAPWIRGNQQQRQQHNRGVYTKEAVSRRINSRSCITIEYARDWSHFIQIFCNKVTSASIASVIKYGSNTRGYSPKKSQQQQQQEECQHQQSRNHLRLCSAATGTAAGISCDDRDIVGYDDADEKSRCFSRSTTTNNISETRRRVSLNKNQKQKEMAAAVPAGY
eukprot:jgi/Bigna1/135712/aug1.30_g10420